MLWDKEEQEIKDRILMSGQRRILELGKYPVLIPMRGSNKTTQKSLL